MTSSDDFLNQLEAQAAAEEAADAATEEKAPADRDVVPFEGFASGGVSPREIDGTAYEELGD